MQLCKDCNEQLFGDPVSTLRADPGDRLLTACDNCLKGFIVDDTGRVLVSEATAPRISRWGRLAGA